MTIVMTLIGLKATRVAYTLAGIILKQALPLEDGFLLDLPFPRGSSWESATNRIRQQHYLHEWERQH